MSDWKVTGAPHFIEGVGMVYAVTKGGSRFDVREQEELEALLVGWVSVEDKFPSEEDGQILVCYLKPFFGVPKKNYTTGYFEDGEGWLYWDGDKPIGYPVTRWKPFLPAPAN